MSLDSLNPGSGTSAKIKIHSLSVRAEETSMLANQPYHPSAIMRFELSLLRLGAALEPSSANGCGKTSVGALDEAEQLESLIEPRDRR